MPQIINTNIASLTAQRNLDKSQSANQQALSRLSSGLRINSSKDDAAGLAISTRFTSQIKGLGVAIRNVGDGVSLAQTADGALGTMTDNLQRIRELSIQSANATNSDVDREALQAEVTQLVAEISRTGEQTTFNGIKLLDGEFDATFQIGANVGETVSFGISELTADSLGGGKSAGVSALGSSNALNNGDLVINGVVVGASTAADDSASTSNAAASGIAKAAAINKVSDQTGVTATALTNIATGSEQQAASGGANSTSGTLSLNGVEIALATGDVDQAADRSAVVTAINSRSAETGVVATDSGTAEGGVTLEAADGRNISLTFSSEGSDNLSAASTGLTSNAVSEGGYTLTSTDGNSPVVVTAGTGSLSNAGLVEGSFSANTAAVNTTSRSSRAEVTSDVGDTGALASTITGGEAVDLTNANFLAGDTTFDITIAGATSTFEDTTATVTLNGDFRGQTVDALVAEINSDLSGNIAAEAYVGEGDTLAFRRTTAEAGTLSIGNFTTGSVPGGNTTIIASLGLAATDTVGAGTALTSATNTDRGGQVGRAALTGTAAVAASIEGNSDFTAADFSGTNVAQFDIVVAGADTASDNGTYSVSLDTDFTNGLYADFQTDSADADRVLETINAEIASAGAEGIVEAKFNGTRTRLVLERVNAESGGSVAIDNFVASSGSSAAAQQTALGFTAGRSSTDGSAQSTVGADAKAAGASDAIGGTAIGVDVSSSLISGGIANATTDAFSAFTAETAATIAAAGATSTDFTAAAGTLQAQGAITDLNFAGTGSTFTETTGFSSSQTSFTVTLADVEELDFAASSFELDLTVGGVNQHIVLTGDYDGGTGADDGTEVGLLQTALDAAIAGGALNGLVTTTIDEGANTLTFTSVAAGAAETIVVADGGSAVGNGANVAADFAAGTQALGVDAFDFSGGNDLSFTIGDGGDTAVVAITGDFSATSGDGTGITGLINAINTTLDTAAGLGDNTLGSSTITVTEDTGNLVFTTDDGGTTTSIVFSADLSSGTQATLGAELVAAGTGGTVANGTDTDQTFVVTDGTEQSEVTLDQNYADNAALVAAINAQLDAATGAGTTGGLGDGTGGSSTITVGLATNTLEFTNDTIGGSSVEITAIGGNSTNSGISGAVAANVGTLATTFTVNDGTKSTAITLDADYATSGGVASAINDQLVADGSSAFVSDAGGTLSLNSSLTGSSATVTVSALTEDPTNITQFANGTDTGVDGNNLLTFNIGGVDTTVDLAAAPGDVTLAGGGDVIASYLNSISGLDASYNSASNQFTVAATNGDADLTLVDGSGSALEYLGLSAGTFENTEAVTGTETVAAVNLNALSEGDLKINGVTIASSSAADDTASSSLANSSDKAASGIAIAAAINASADETGVSATVNATVVDGGNNSVGTAARTADGDQGTIYINGFSTNTLSLGSDSEVNRTDAIAAINKISGQTGVTATDAGDYTRLTAADGRNISIAIDNQGTTFSGDNIGLSSSLDGIAEADFSQAGNSFASVAETTASTVTLSSAREFSISAGTNGTAGLEGLGLVAGTYGGSEDGQFLADIDISTVEGAEAAILALDNAIATVSSQRADLGAIQNRLESTVGNLTVTAENLTAANSRITDADFAVETAELSRSQVLQQAGISILAQANASSQQVLSLLQ